MLSVTSDEKYWVLIESGSNQEFILQSTRRRFQVGASELVKRLESWVTGAVADTRRSADLVVCTSSKAMLRVADREVGKAVVAQVTRQALIEAPGLDVWGYVDNVATSDGHCIARLGEVYAGHTGLRWARPGPQRRFPQRPFLETCPITARPATKVMDDPTKARAQSPELPRKICASALTQRAYDVAGAALAELRCKFGDGVQRHLDQELTNAGWVAVVHADGNGLGEIIARIGTSHQLKEFSEQLNEATKAAFEAAINEVGGDNWIIPLVLGGDDVTFVCDGRKAIAMTRVYLTEFERQTSGRNGLSAAVQSQTERSHLTACAGIAFVKPHFPFHAAFTLAESLCRNAKTTTKQQAPDRSSYDFHVVHDSVLKRLSTVRAGLRLGANQQVDLWSAPFLAPSPVQLAPSTQEDSGSAWETRHEDALLLADVDFVLEAEEDRAISGATLSSIREALIGAADAGRAAEASMGRTLDRVVAASMDASVTEFLTRTLPKRPLVEGFSPFMAILAAADMRTGVLAGPRAAGATS